MPSTCLEVDKHLARGAIASLGEASAPLLTSIDIQMYIRTVKDEKLISLVHLQSISTKKYNQHFSFIVYCHCHLFSLTVVLSGL